MDQHEGPQAGLEVATVQTEAGSRIVMGTYPPEPIGPSRVFVLDAVTGERIGKWRCTRWSWTSRQHIWTETGARSCW